MCPQLAWRIEMRAMVFHRPGEKLVLEIVPDPEPAPNQLLIRVEACGVCRTDLHIIDGDLKRPKPALIPGHEIVGRVIRAGSDVIGFAPGTRVGVPWLGFTCGHCNYCRGQRENLCDEARYFRAKRRLRQWRTPAPVPRLYHGARRQFQ